MAAKTSAKHPCSAIHDTQFVRIKKLTGKDVLRLAGRHNLREIQAEIGADSHIDAKRICLNRVLEGPASAAEIAAQAGRLMEESGMGALRKDAVRGLEVITSLPPLSNANQPAFFADALAWVKAFYGVPVLSAVLHNDEAAPHVHVLLLPLLDGRMQGSDLVGNRARLQTMQTSFHSQVGQKHGLVRPKAARRLSAATRSKSALLILSALQSNPDLLDGAGIESALLTMFERDPEPLMNALGLSIPHPPKGNKSFVEIMTKPCGAEKPIGFDIPAEKKEQTLSCVGFDQKSLPVYDHKAPYQDDFTRCRDADEAGQWDSELGEFVKQQTSASRVSARKLAVAELGRAIARQRTQEPAHSTASPNAPTPPEQQRKLADSYGAWSPTYIHRLTAPSLAHARPAQLH